MERRPLIRRTELVVLVLRVPEGLRRLVPTLLTRTSRVKAKRLFNVLSSSSRPAVVDTSACTATHRGSRDVSSSSGVMSRAQVRTSQPCERNSSTMARPMPLLPPVTSTTLPCNEKCGDGLCVMPDVDANVDRENGVRRRETAPAAGSRSSERLTFLESNGPDVSPSS